MWGQGRRSVWLWHQRASPRGEGALSTSALCYSQAGGSAPVGPLPPEAVLPLSRPPGRLPCPRAAHSTLHPQSPAGLPCQQEITCPSPRGSGGCLKNSQRFGERIKGTDFYSKILEQFNSALLEVLPCLCCLIIINFEPSCSSQRALTSTTSHRTTK